MPIYEYMCIACGAEKDQFSKISERDTNIPQCCGLPMSRLVSTPSVQADNTCYRSMKTGEMITSRTQHKNHLKEHGLIEVGNESMEQKGPSLLDKKKQREALRQEIAAKLDSAVK